MANVTLTILGKSYSIACDDGQENRVSALGNYVDQKLGDIARAGAASSDSHLFVLASLVLADEIFEMRDSLAALGEQVEGAQAMQQEEEMLAETINKLAFRIEGIAERMQAV